MTLPETNIASENWWLGDYFPFRKANVQGVVFCFREGKSPFGVYSFTIFFPNIKAYGLPFIPNRDPQKTT